MKKVTILLSIISIAGIMFFSNKKIQTTNIINEINYYEENEIEDSTPIDLGNEDEALPTDNPVNTTTIEILNIQKDNNNTTYTYKVKIDNVTGAMKYTIDGAENYIVFNSVGEATFTLRANQELVIYDIPYNTAYSVEQLSNDNYITSTNNKNTNKIEGVTAQNNIVSFTNTNKVVSANPNTADYSYIYIITGALSLIALILLIKIIKVKRFTN